ncbi:hypothetical protein LHK_02804 [Laribacter hongkongensis HLHK9]|uniref:Uncharacterized protein n=1 Tax=Laribacter hongkongensis (strain HLHK9) TaxID=557598 RepID=C1DDF2_LARHH|nr:hypothetical protein LHK_02804 [Laribacter hongkongensis HLHK9]
MLKIDKWNRHEETRFMCWPARTYLLPVCGHWYCPCPSSGRGICSPNSLIQPICLAGTPTINA